MKPRHEPGYEKNGKEKFLGHANDLDVYWEPMQYQTFDGYVLIVGPEERKIYNSIGDSVFNYDAYVLKDGVIQEEGPCDLHITPYDMCLIYQLLTEHDVI